MRDSINYNLKYFIMKMSGTKPMKNTMRKPSPLKFMNLGATLDAASKVAATAGAAAKKVKSAKAAAATKPVEGKPASRPKPSMSKSKAEMATKMASTVKKNVSNAAKTPAMQMKKSGMGKKC
jgi:hypothetical protein